jgi:hypothetical protein
MDCRLRVEQSFPGYRRTFATDGSLRMADARIVEAERRAIRVNGRRNMLTNVGVERE